MANEEVEEEEAKEEEDEEANFSYHQEDDTVRPKIISNAKCQIRNIEKTKPNLIKPTGFVLFVFFFRFCCCLFLRSLTIFLHHHRHPLQSFYYPLIYSSQTNQPLVGWPMERKPFGMECFFLYEKEAILIILHLPSGLGWLVLVLVWHSSC